MTNGVSRAQKTASNRSRVGSGRRARAWLAAALAFGVLAAACEDRRGTTTVAPDKDAAAMVGGATISDVTSMADTYLGKTAAVAGEVGVVLGPRTFTLGGDDWGGEVLVVASEPITSVRGRTGATMVQPGDVVLTMGTVRRFSASEIQKDLGGPMPGGLGAQYEGKPVIVARANQIFVTPRRTSAAMAAATPDAGTGDAATPGAESAILDITTLLTAPDRAALVGRPVTLTDVRVQKVISNKDFWIAWVGPSASQQVVAVYDKKSTPGKFDVEAGKTTSITGAVQRLPSVDQMKSQWKLSQSEADSLKAQAVYLDVTRIALAMR